MPRPKCSMLRYWWMQREDDMDMEMFDKKIGSLTMKSDNSYIQSLIGETENERLRNAQRVKPWLDELLNILDIREQKGNITIVYEWDK